MKTNFLSQKIIVVIGASGGLGGALVRKLVQVGATPVLAGRNKQAMELLVHELKIQPFIHSVDVLDYAGLEVLCRQVIDTHGRVDAVVNVSGMDIRKSFDSHSPEEIQKEVSVNLTGSMLVTRAFMPQMKTQKFGQILLVGGFGNGRLSLPYFSVDVAARAGLATFVEALNRELQIDNSPIVVSFFSPEPANTTAEKPYFPLWREMAVDVVPAEQVAAAMIKTLSERKKSYIMGNWSTKLSGVINDVFPGLVDIFMLKSYGTILKKHLGEL